MSAMMRGLLLVGAVVMVSGIACAQQQDTGPVPVVIEAVAPGYPRQPSGGREDAEVQVEITIDSEGSVVAAKALSGPSALRAVAESAAREWKFEKQDRSATMELVFAFLQRTGLGDSPKACAAYKAPNRIEVFAEAREIVTIADPQMVDVEKEKKKPQKPE